MADFGIISKVKLTGMTKEEFVAQFGDDLKEKAGTIFDQFNTNDQGVSKGKLDLLEQADFLAYYQSLDKNNDGKIQDGETVDGGKIEKAHFQKSMEAYGAKADKDATVTQSGGKAVTLKIGNVTMTRKPSGITAHLSNDWNNQRSIGESIANGTATDENLKKIQSSITAQEVLTNILASDAYKDANLSDDEKNNLLTLLIKANPSIFNPNNGSVYLGADWSKMDFPSAEYVKGKNFDTSSVTTTGAAGIKDQTGNEAIAGFGDNKTLSITADYTAPSADEADNTAPSADEADNSDNVDEPTHLYNFKGGKDYVTVSNGEVKYYINNTEVSGPVFGRSHPGTFNNHRFDTNSTQILYKGEDGTTIINNKGTIEYYDTDGTTQMTEADFKAKRSGNYANFRGQVEKWYELSETYHSINFSNNYISQ